jgi:hypothetical protein
MMAAEWARLVAGVDADGPTTHWPLTEEMEGGEWKRKRKKRNKRRGGKRIKRKNK